jgi:hypothetical protein
MRYTEEEFDDYLKLAVTVASALQQIRQLDDAASRKLIAEAESDLMEVQSKVNKARFSVANDHGGA